jgi:hypothetical protein
VRGLLNFIGSNPWLLVIIIGGLFNVGVRLNQKAKEQRAKRAALTEIQRRKSEALRTGKPMTEPIIVYDEPQKKQPNTSEDRQARIESLRQQRMAQLRAIREKRSGVAAQSTTASPPTRPGAAPAGRPQPSPQRPQPIQRQTQRPATARPAPAQRPPTRPRRAIPAPTPAPTPRPAPPSIPSISPVAGVPEPVKATKPLVSAYGIQTRSHSGGDDGSIRSMLSDPRQLRNAIVLREVLDGPIALRDPENGPGGVAR